MRPALIAASILALAGFACPPAFEAVRHGDPLSADEHASLAAIYEREGNLDRAAQEYMAAVDDDPGNLAAITGLANVAYLSGKPRLAVTYYKRALEIDPHNPVVLNNLAMAYLDLGRPKKALEAADRAVEISEGVDPRLLHTRALARLAVGDREGARQDLAAALELCRGREQAEESFDASTSSACEEVRLLLEGMGE